MRFVIAGVLIVFSIGAWGCSSGYSSPNSPTAPSPSPSPASTPPPAGTVTINVVAINGAQSFSPNPATLPAGQSVVWHNVDGVTHRVVLDNGSVDTGNLAPGASSQPMSINTGAGTYHCSIHPSMVGTIAAAASRSSSR